MLETDYRRREKSLSGVNMIEIWTPESVAQWHNFGFTLTVYLIIGGIIAMPFIFIYHAMKNRFPKKKKGPLDI